jgi:ribonuclease HII
MNSYFSENTLEAGVDEAGRGCLAGPVVAAAVILPKDFYHPLLRDSKKMKEGHRLQLKEEIQKRALAYGIGIVEAPRIDEINILQATFEAMHLAIDQLKESPNLLLIDGNRFVSYKKLAHECIVKGDSQYASIAAASVLAKTTRDEIMRNIHIKFPYYQWNKNKGYPTLQHKQSIAKKGLSPFHRKTFRHQLSNEI